MITIKVVASLNFFGQGNYCTKNLCAMCTGTKADFSQCILKRYYTKLWFIFIIYTDEKSLSARNILLPRYSFSSDAVTLIIYLDKYVYLFNLTNKFIYHKVHIIFYLFQPKMIYLLKIGLNKQMIQLTQSNSVWSDQICLILSIKFE